MRRIKRPPTSRWCMGRLASVSALVAWSLVSVGASQSNPVRHPDFSGTWVFEGSQSDAIYSPLGMEAVIKHDAAAIAYTSRGRDVSIGFGVPETHYATMTVRGEVWQHVGQFRWIQDALLVTDRTDSPIGSWEDGFIL